MSEDIYVDEKWIWDPDCEDDTDTDQQQAAAPRSDTNTLDSPVEVYVVEQDDEGDELRNTLSQLKEEPQDEEAATPPPPTHSAAAAAAVRRQCVRAAHSGTIMTSSSIQKRLGLRFVTTTKRMQPYSGDDYSSPDEAEGQQVLHPKRPRVIYLTVEQEDNVAEWLREHQLFYNKKLNDYKDVRKKYRLMQEKASELNVHVNQLRTWIDGMRTRFGRLCAARSQTQMTEREQWIYTAFSFLQPHIVRCPTRQAKKLTTTKELTVQTTAASQQDSLAAVSGQKEQQQQQADIDTPPLAPPPWPTPATTSPGRTPQSACAMLEADAQDLLQQLTAHCRQDQETAGAQTRLQQPALQSQSTQARQVTHFMSFLGSLCETMTPAAWRSFSVKAHQLALQHLAAEPPPPLQPQPGKPAAV